MADGEDIVSVRLSYRWIYIAAIELTTSLGNAHRMGNNISAVWVDASPPPECGGAPLRLAWIAGIIAENAVYEGVWYEGVYPLSLTLRWAYR